MKLRINTLLLATLVFMTCFTARGQKVHFTDTSNVWKVVQPMYDVGWGGVVWSFYYSSFRFSGRNLIDSTEYVDFGFGLVREDTIAKKVYLRRSDTDVVLMDYNLNVGDTFFAPQQKFVVTGIDSTIINSVWHKVWYFPFYVGGWYSSGGPITVIEGIGCIQGPTFMFSHYNHDGCVECAEPFMYCFSNNGYQPVLTPSVRWLNNTSSCSYYEHLDVKQLYADSKEVTIYPNPSNQFITLVSPAIINDISIINMIGQTVFASQYNSKQVEVDVSHLEDGLYVVRVNGVVVNKFMKQ